MAESLAERYLDRYKALEEACREAFDVEVTESAVVKLKRMKQFRSYAEDIDYCRTVRNFLQHNPKLGADYPVEPSTEMVAFIDFLIERIHQRQRCVQIAVTGERLRTCTAQDTLASCMEAMRDGAFSHMPVTKDKRVIGIVDMHSIFKLLADKGVCDATEQLSVGEAMDYVSLNEYDGIWEHPDREGEVYTFLGINDFVDEAEVEFESWFKRGRRLGAALLTQNGAQHEKVLGLITAWDILGNPQA